MDESASKKRKLDEPYVRDSAYILRKHGGKLPSLIIHLHPTHFRFEGQDGSFAYDSPVKAILQHLRTQTVPHEMLEELLQQNVPFYDGCLIIEVHNHISAGAKTANNGGTTDLEDGPRFSMNNYNEHITPSPFAPYPKKAAESSPRPRVKAEESTNGDMAAPEKPNKTKDEGGPKVTTVVLHPTQLTTHYEMLLLAESPVSEAGEKKKGAEAEPNGQPPTPRLSVPPTPSTTGRGPLSESLKMMLEEGNMYEFEADMLVATQPPLMLEPAHSFEESQRLLEMMAHPLHSGKPPSPKTRKRTTAEMAADDAQAAEEERRMLIMDERIKPSGRSGAGATANDNQGAAASLSFSRFKTLEMVRQKHEEAERVKKEEDARLAVEKKQYEEQMQREKLTQQTEQRRLLAQQQQQSQLAHRQNMLLQQKQNAERAQQVAAAQAQAQQHQQQLMAQQQVQQNHGHPQQGFQHPGSVAQQGSPAPRQQTPMMNSSPMMGNGGAPMVATSSQGAGSPPRPTSAAIPQHVAMARNQSQQQGSRNNTPQISQGTPNMAQTIPNRQASQTPRIPHGSPAPGMQDGTPTAMAMPTPQFNNQGQQLTPEQMMLLSQRNQQNLQHASMQGMAGSPQSQMTPELFQQAAQANMQNRRMQIERQRVNHLRQAQIAMNQQNQGLAHQHHLKAREYQAMLQLNTQQQAGSPMNHQTPNMGHGHPGQQQHMNNMQQSHPQQGDPNMLAQQHAMQQQARNNEMRQAQAQGKLQQLAQQHGGYQHIPPHLVQQLPPAMQNMLRHQQSRQAQQRVQAMAAMRQQQGVGDPNNPAQYMQNLRQTQAMLAGQMQGIGGGGGAGSPGPMPAMTPGGMNQMQMPGNMMNQQQQYAAIQQNQQGGGGGDNLNASFAAMQNALNGQQARGQ